MRVSAVLTACILPFSWKILSFEYCSDWNLLNPVNVSETAKKIMPKTTRQPVTTTEDSYVVPTIIHVYIIGVFDSTILASPADS